MAEVSRIFENTPWRSHDAAWWVRTDLARAQQAIRHHETCGIECSTLAAAARVIRNSR